jgi:hypothetical protein
MTVLSPVTTHQRQEVLVGKWNPPPVTVIQALPALTSAEIIGQEASGPGRLHKRLRVDGLLGPLSGVGCTGDNELAATS